MSDEEAIIRCGTTKGEITLHLIRKWSPNGFDKAVELFERQYYDGSHFFRVVPKFLVQFGISYSKDKQLQSFARKQIKDDPKFNPPISFEPGTISYAGSGPNSRNSQLFISYGSAASLGTQLWETPIGEVISGLNHAEEFYSYGDMPPWGKGPTQVKIHGHPEYIDEGFPLTDKFLLCTVKRTTTSGTVTDDEENDNADATDEEKNDKQTESPTDPEDIFNKEADKSNGGKALRRKRRVGQDVGNEKEDFFAVPQDKLGIMKSKLKHGKDAISNGTNSNSGLIAVAILILVAMIVLYVTRGRRKDDSKRN